LEIPLVLGIHHRINRSLLVGIQALLPSTIRRNQLLAPIINSMYRLVNPGIIIRRNHHNSQASSQAMLPKTSRPLRIIIRLKISRITQEGRLVMAMLRNNNCNNSNNPLHNNQALRGTILVSQLLFSMAV